jgi:hypothetical protein
MIGEPIDHQKFIQSKQKNAKGDNRIPSIN